MCASWISRWRARAGFGVLSSNGGRMPSASPATTAHRRLVRTSIAAVSEEASGILSGDAIEGGSQRLLQRLDRARGDPAQISFHFGPSGFDRAEVRAVGGQIAIGKA